MQVVVELWKARPGWFDRSQAERATYLESVVPAIRQFLVDGVELLALGAAEPGRKDYTYWAVWRFPDENRLVDYTHAIESIGWHENFERVNVEVEARDLEEILSTQTNFG